MTTLPYLHDTSPAYRELHAAITGHWQHLAEQPHNGWTDDQIRERAAQQTARLYERIVIDGQNAEHLRLRAEATNAAALEEAQQEAQACRDVLRALIAFAHERLADDDTARHVYATIGRHNLGDSYQPGDGDRYVLDAA